MRSRLLVLPAVGALLVGTAAPASATVTVSGGGTVRGDEAHDNVSVSCPGGVLTASGVTAGESCATLTQLSVQPGAGGDIVNLGALTPTDLPLLTHIDVWTEDGGMLEPDAVVGSALSEWMTGDSMDTLNGGGGADMIDGAGSASGGDGDDSFQNVSDIASGGAGDDRFIQFVASGGIDGGPGIDTWELDYDQVALGVGPQGLHLALDESGLAVDILGDGNPAGKFNASGLERVYATLLRVGPQTWDGTGFLGEQDVRGVAGPDTVIGGPSDDALFGGTGADTVTGGGGSDVLRGGDDNDTVNARDGVSDRIDCGAGTDTVVADASDVVTGCETVQLPAVVTPTPPVAVVPTTGKVKGPDSVAKGTTAKFKLSSATAGATFQCKVDKARWKSCASPYKVTTRKLSLGKHKLSVRAVLAGVADPTPSVRKFRVVRSS